MTTCKHQLLARKRITRELWNTVTNRPTAVSRIGKTAVFFT